MGSWGRLGLSCLIAALGVLPHPALAQPIMAAIARTCIAQVPNGGDSERYLRKIGPFGKCRPGETLFEWDRRGFGWRGSWHSADHYKLNDAVSFNGSSFLSLSDDNIGIEPGTNSAVWSVLALEGEPGEDGASGSSGATGPPGPTGQMGLAGVTGPAGADGLAGPTGAAGSTGPAGIMGAMGPAGVPGATGAVGVLWRALWETEVGYKQNDAVSLDGSSYLSLIDDNVGVKPGTNPHAWGVLALTGEPGPEGAQGSSGAAGPPGGTGQMGPPGATGSRGPEGPAGATGVGAPGIGGPKGDPGAIGPTGTVGATGPPGAIGVAGIVWRGAWNIQIHYTLDDAISFDGSSYRSLIDDNSGVEPGSNEAAWSVLARAGERGAEGLTGATGSVGATGTMGARGSTGAAGATGPAGLPGPTGAAGAVGPTGPAGAAGPVGPTGIAGTDGLQGLTGPNGSTGPIGPVGEQGPQGEPGLSPWRETKEGITYDGISLQLGQYGGGSLLTDAAGHVLNVSDGKLMNEVGSFGRGLEAILKLEPITYKWSSESTYDQNTAYAGFDALDVADLIPEAVGTDAQGRSTLSDRALIASLVNAVKEQNVHIVELETRLKSLEK